MATYTVPGEWDGMIAPGNEAQERQYATQFENMNRRT